MGSGFMQYPEPPCSPKPTFPEITSIVLQCQCSYYIRIVQSGSSKGLPTIPKQGCQAALGGGAVVALDDEADIISATHGVCSPERLKGKNASQESSVSPGYLTDSLGVALPLL